MSATLYCGDARDVLATLPERSVQAVVTSPPYWGLRDYGQPGQLGLERTPEEYVATLVAVFREVRRVLRDDGTVWINLGDSYTANGKSGDTRGGFNARYFGTGAPGKQAEAVDHLPTRVIPIGLKPKDLCGIPWRVAFALQSDGWYLRSDIIWAKPNPMPESVTDRPTKSHEFVFLLTKSERYYYDAAAIAEPGVEPERQRNDRIGGANGHTVRHSEGGIMGATATRNARSVWTIATQPYAGAHFATMPRELARRCILAGSAAKACEECGAPWERVIKRGDDPTAVPLAERPEHGRNQPGNANWKAVSSLGYGRPALAEDWWPTCNCLLNTGGAQSVVLDPFGGSGTVAAVAVGHGRRAIHGDLNPEYIELARQRIGPMLCGVA